LFLIYLTPLLWYPYYIHDAISGARVSQRVIEMFISEEEARRRLEHDNNLLNEGKKEDEVLVPEVVGEVKNQYGYGSGVPVPPAFRAFLGIQAHHDTVQNVAKVYGSNHVTVGNAKKGLNSNGQPVAEGEVVKNSIQAISDKVLDLLLAGTQTVHVDELRALPVGKRLSALKDVAAIHGNITPKTPIVVQSKILTIMSPGVGQETDFQVLEIEG
jgi:hypothetical protein